MAEATPNRQEHLFIVRLWSDSGTNFAQWRGQVEHIPTQQKFYFVHLEDLNRFMARHLGENNYPPDTPHNQPSG
jgi:hypothetical protein